MKFRWARVGTVAVLAGVPILAVLTNQTPASAAPPAGFGRIAYVGQTHQEIAYTVDGEVFSFFGTEAATTDATYDASGGLTQGLTWVSAAQERHGEIFVQTGDDTGVTRVTNDTATDRHPALSPDGTKIAFDSDRGGQTAIWVVNVDGSGLHRVSTPPALPPGSPPGSVPAADSAPTWSPDGSRLAFSSTRDNTHGEVYTIAAAATTPSNDAAVRVSVFGSGTAATVGATDPAWDPDASLNRIAFTVTNFAATPAPTQHVLAAVASASGALTTLVPTTLDSSQPSWDQSGDTIAFVSRTRNPDGGVYTLTVDNPAATPQLVRDDNRNAESHPTWYTNGETGTSVLFTHLAVDEPGEVLDVNSTDGSGVRDLSFRPGATEGSPAYTSDGKKVAWTRTFSDHTDIVVANANGTSPVKLTRTVAGVRNTDPVFSPDGSKIAYTSAGRIVVANAVNGTVLFQIAAPPGNDGNGNFIDGEANWSPDGATIVFSRYLIPPTGSSPGLKAKALTPNALDGLNTDIWTARASDGQGQVDLTAADDTTSVSFDRNPAFDPVDRNTIAFVRNGLLRRIVLGTTTNVESALPIPTIGTDTVFGVQTPAWSPDGTQIAFSGVHGPVPDRDIGILTIGVPPAANTLRWLTNNPGDETHPAWQPTADLQVSLAPAPTTTVVVNTTTNLTATIVNGGPAGARNVHLALTLPPAGATRHIQVQTISITSPSPPTGATCSVGTLTCDIPSLASGGTVAVTISVLGTSVTGTPGDLVTATVSGTVLDVAPVNDSASTSVIVQSPPTGFRNVGVAASATPSPSFAGGDDVVVTFTVTNNGAVALNGVTLTSQFPETTTPKPAIPSKGTCATPLSCVIGTLAVGATATVKVPLSPLREAPSEVASTTVTNATGDDDATDNSAKATFRVLQPTFTLNPPLGAPGFVTIATGVNFPPGTTVNFHWDLGIDASGSGVVVQPNGTFTTQVLILRKDLLGNRILTASGPHFGAVPTVTYLVVPRSQQPPRFVGRN
ncbi:MAG: hypothetical protein ACJ73S_31270 [Mycobacteriales bacterium]